MRKGWLGLVLKLVGGLMLIACVLPLSYAFGIISVVLLLVGTVLLTAS